MLAEKTPAAIAAAAHGPGLRSSARPPGTATSQSSTPGARNRAEYFDITARPAARPAASHQAARRVRQNRASVQSVTDQNRLAGASGIASIPPRPTVRVALYQSAARKAVRPSAPSARASSPISQLETPLASTAATRTPSGVSPNNVSPARIHQAIIGGWSR